MAWKVIIAGGGTGGHIFPAIAIAQAILKEQPTAEILFVGAKGKMEMEKVPQAGFKIIGLDIVGLNRSNIFKNLSLPFKLIKSRLQAKKILKEFRPNIVIGVGGFASFPMLNAAQSMNIPTLIQEQNSRAGRSNIMLSKKANTICTAYEGMEQYFHSKDALILAGNPVRQQIKSKLTRTDVQAKYGITSEDIVVFIVGGSLGATSINNAMLSHYPKIMERKNVHIFWQTGKNDFVKIQEVVKEVPRIKVFDFIKNIEELYALADVIISRAGAMAISELCIIGKPVIFVPYPFAAEDHQTINANYLVKRNAAVSIPDTQVTERLADELIQLIDNEEKRKMMSENILKMAIIDADERIVNEIKRIIEK